MAKKQLEVFYALDVAKTQWYHFTVFTIVGMGFFTGAYNLFCISTVTRLIGRLYYFDSTSAKPAPGSLPPNVLAAVNGVALCGTLAGQLFFGWMGDKLGRKKVYGITLLLMATTSIASGLSLGGTAKSVITTLCFFRFWLGFGIGGNYPLSATIMAEYANKRTRGGFIAAVFAMQGFGMLAVGAVAMIVSAGFKKKYSGQSFQIDQESSFHRKADYVWRIILMFGAVPAALTYYLQMKIPETARYTALVERNVKQAAADMSKLLRVDIKEDEILVESQEQPARFGLFSREFARRHGWHLVGTACTWFLLDIAFYSQNLFQKDMFTAAGWLPLATKMNAIEEVYRIARAQLIIALFSTVPGYWFTVAFVDNIGRKTIQLVGFFLMTFFMFVLSIRYNRWRGTECLKGYCGGHPEAFVIFYAFTFFFSNFGPNSTTFIVPAEIFPARFRSTCYGISAAAGKAGAIIGAFGFLYAAQSTDPLKVQKGFHTGIGVKNCLLILGVTNALGSLFTFLIPETIEKSLEELSGENDEEQGDGTAAYQIRRGYR